MSVNYLHFFNPCAFSPCFFILPSRFLPLSVLPLFSTYHSSPEGKIVCSMLSAIQSFASCWCHLGRLYQVKQLIFFKFRILLAGRGNWTAGTIEWKQSSCLRPALLVKSPSIEYMAYSRSVAWLSLKHRSCPDASHSFLTRQKALLQFTSSCVSPSPSLGMTLSEFLLGWFYHLSFLLLFFSYLNGILCPSLFFVQQQGHSTPHHSFVIHLISTQPVVQKGTFLRREQLLEAIGLPKTQNRIRIIWLFEQHPRTFRLLFLKALLFFIC